MLLVLLLRAQQGLPPRLMLAAGPERRALQPGAGQRLQLLEPRRELGRSSVHMGAAAGPLQHPLQHAVALPLHRFTPGLGNLGTAGIAASKACSHFLHGAVPAASLFAEPTHRLFRRCRPGLGQQLTPPVEQVLPTARVVASGGSRHSRVAQGIAPGTEVLPGQVLEIAAAGVVGRAGHRAPPQGWVMAWECAGSC
ncbi:hypothetical protein D3C72_1714110 [compost metagenome]